MSSLTDNYFSNNKNYGINDGYVTLYTIDVKHCDSYPNRNFQIKETYLLTKDNFFELPLTKQCNFCGVCYKKIN